MTQTRYQIFQIRHTGGLMTVMFQGDWMQFAKSNMYQGGTPLMFRDIARFSHLSKSQLN